MTALMAHPPGSTTSTYSRLDFFIFPINTLPVNLIVRLSHSLLGRFRTIKIKNTWTPTLQTISKSFDTQMKKNMLHSSKSSLLAATR